MSQDNSLTSVEYWNSYWSSSQRPTKIDFSRNFGHNEILANLVQFVPTGTDVSVAEIGGAPGSYLEFVMRQCNVRGTIVDYSKIGCEQAREYFAHLNLDVEIIESDLSTVVALGRKFDVVYSLGFIEHFVNVSEIVDLHAKLVRPGGILILGCPNFRGINGWFLRRLAPELLATHNMEVMDSRSWDKFESSSNLSTLRKGYLGGFEPRVFYRSEFRNLKTFLLKSVAGFLVVLTRPRVFKLHNRWWFSQYLMGVYRIPEDTCV
jgi:2-polyprenyl-3-methyl-5-hydroxy-6-metoxy-1,4-benzoquinol methylase